MTVEATALRAYNTLRVPAWADELVVVRATPDLEAVAGRARATGRPLTVLGGGSNVVLLKRVAGTVCVVRTRGMRFGVMSNGLGELTLAAGEPWHDVVRATLDRGWYGLENLALIPGSVGAAPIQNIGAYGVELADRFLHLTALDLHDGRKVQLDREACSFGYRDSLFKGARARGRYLILEVTLELSAEPRLHLDYPDLRAELVRVGLSAPTPRQVAAAVVRVRRRKLPDPRRVGNAGSFFKNPVIDDQQLEALRSTWPMLKAHEQVTQSDAVLGAARRFKLAAAQLIDLCGWKARPAATVAAWPQQPLVLINRGDATGQDFLAYSDAIRAEVERRFGIRLELEPTVIGE